jgi:hypothetical protein
MPCSLLKVNRCFGGTSCSQLQGRRISQAKNHREAGSKQISVTCCLLFIFQNDAHLPNLAQLRNVDVMRILDFRGWKDSYSGLLSYYTALKFRSVHFSHRLRLYCIHCRNEGRSSSVSDVYGCHRQKVTRFRYYTSVGNSDILPQDFPSVRLPTLVNTYPVS